ncbi:MAG: gliding motility-associated ABC transporter substrate-binding protein GldG [Mongoliitalea sp.]
MKKNSSITLLIGAGILAALVVLLTYVFPFRIDLTEEKRYSLNPATIDFLKQLDEPVEIEILLTGKLPGGMRRLQRSTEEMIRTFDAYSSKKISFYYQDPLVLSKDIQEDYIVGLAEYGINPTNLFVTDDAGQQSILIWPGIVARTEEFETGALLLKGERMASNEEILNQSIENLEFELVNAIRKLVGEKQYSIGLMMGHGELSEDDGFGLVEALVDDYEVFKIPVEQAKKVEDLDPFAVLIVSGPRESYDERAIYLIDQYLMNGGNVIFLVDALVYDMKEAGGDGSVAMPFEHGLDNILFRYGIRVNKDFIQDINFGYYPVMAGNFGNQEQLAPLPWPFFIKASLMAKHPITKGLDQVLFRFNSSLDTVKAEGVRKTPLIFTSEFSRRLSAPVRIAFEDMASEPDLEEFNQAFLPLVYLLEGEFTSVFKNRFLPEGMDKTTFQEQGSGGKVLVVGSSSVFTSQLELGSGNPLPLGEDPFNAVTFANRQLLQNTIAYLTEPEGLIASRSKQFKIRPLNKAKVRQEKSFWQWFNVGAPLAFLALVGGMWFFVRKMKYKNG